MADHLTQLQDCFDQLATQMFASLRYIATHHEGQPGGASNGDDPPRPDSPGTFAAALEELSRDLVAKEQQIERLIETLPGRGRSVEEQEAEIRRLNKELADMDAEVEAAAQQKQEMLDRLDRVIAQVKRY